MEDVVELMTGASQTVLGVVTARFADDIDGTLMVIQSYMREARADGYDEAQAWAQLFSAAVLLLMPLVSCKACHHEASIDEVLDDIGMFLARSRLA